MCCVYEFNLIRSLKVTYFFHFATISKFDVFINFCTSVSTKLNQNKKINENPQIVLSTH